MPFDPVFSKILVAYDGSEQSKKAVRIAARMALMFHGEVLILTVVPTVSYPIYHGDMYGGATTVMTEAEVNGMKIAYDKALEDARGELAEYYPQLHVETALIEGRPSSVIVEEAEKRDVALIVIGRRGLGGISGWILGSTSRKVVDSCTKPVLVVK